jgi:hypothetical protein
MRFGVAVEKKRIITPTPPHSRHRSDQRRSENESLLNPAKALESRTLHTLRNI